MRKIVNVGLAAAAIAGAAVIGAGTANATDGAGCPTDEVMCYGWSRNWNRPDLGQNGAISYFRGNAWDLNTAPYFGSGAGSGQAIGNNNGSLWVNEFDSTETIYYNPSPNGQRPGGYNITYGFGVRTCIHNPDTDWGVLPWYICNNARSHFGN